MHDGLQFPIDAQPNRAAQQVLVPRARLAMNESCALVKLSCFLMRIGEGNLTFGQQLEQQAFEGILAVCSRCLFNTSFQAIQ
jgi:hypothetical protein